MSDAELDDGPPPIPVPPTPSDRPQRPGVGWIAEDWCCDGDDAGVGCLVPWAEGAHGERYDRIPFGSELTVDYTDDACAGCKVERGELHHTQCPNDECPRPACRQIGGECRC